MAARIRLGRQGRPLRRANRSKDAPAAPISRQELLIVSAAHELQAPLTIARGQIELLQRRCPSADLDVALEELERLEDIVRRMVFLAELETARLRLVPLDLRGLLDTAAAGHPSVVVERSSSAIVAGDEETLLVAIGELIDNALLRSDDLGRVALSAGRADGRVAISVADTGPGVDPTRADWLFDCFARAGDDCCRACGGAGLGLAIVRAIAGAHGGDCCVRNRRRGPGAVWSLCLPITEGG